LHPTDDADLRASLSALGPGALTELRVLLEDGERRRAVLRVLVARPAYADLAQLIAMADSDESVRLRLLRSVRESGWWTCP
jgi:hypothetical protein